MWKKVLFALLWLVIWRVVALIINNPILFAGPYETLLALFRLIQQGSFWLSVGNSLLRIFIGFLIGVVAGILLMGVAYRFPLFADFLSPLVLVMKSVPVASFVIILLIFAGNNNVALIIVAVVVFPIVYVNLLEAGKNLDKRPLEMAKLYRISFADKLRYVYYPGLKTALASALVLAVGMAFKSGVAAEVIATPLNTIGNGMYMSKIQLLTDEVLAWTVVIVILSKGIETMVRLIFKVPSKRENKNDLSESHQ